MRFALLRADPFDEGVHVAEARQVHGHKPQGRTARGVRAVCLLGPLHDGGAEAVARGDDRRTACEQTRHDLPGN